MQRVRKALDPPGEAREDLWIIYELARRMGSDSAEASAERTWDEVRAISPVHRGMTYQRLEELGGIQWPCWDEEHPGELFLHSRLWEDPVPGLRRRSSRSITTAGRQAGRRLPHPPHHRPPARLVRRRRPVRRLHVTAAARAVARHLPEDAERLSLAEGERVKVTSRRGSIEVPVRLDPSLRPGLTFMTLHFQDDVQTNILTIDATDPKSGTAEFKATAIRIEKLAQAEAAVQA